MSGSTEVRRRHALGFALVLAGLLVSAAPAVAGEYEGEASGDSITVTAREAASVQARADAIDPALRLVEYRRAEMCAVTTAQPTTPLNGRCAGYAGAVQIPSCEGQTPVLPLWRRDRDTPTSAWGPWRMAIGWSCPQDAPPVFTAEDFRRLPITPSVLTIQPDRAEVLVNMPTVVFTDPAVQDFTTTVLGYPIEVQATPVSYTWNFGDGSDPTTTTSPGHPYPGHDVFYRYPRLGTYTITLTTEFAGTYRVAGDTTWLPVTGTATTTTTAPPITATEARTHLVAGDCTQTPTPLGC
jgi:hypothetical protein